MTDAESKDLHNELRAVERLFDREWYLNCNPDVAASGLDPAVHYLRYGSKEGRWPNAVFDPRWYKETNHDLSGWPRDPLSHFALYGRFEHRKPNPNFDRDTYLRLNPDVAEDGIEPVEHYVRYGRSEGRAITDETAGQVSSVDATIHTASNTANSGAVSIHSQIIAERRSALSSPGRDEGVRYAAPKAWCLDKLSSLPRPFSPKGLSLSAAIDHLPGWHLPAADKGALIEVLPLTSAADLNERTSSDVLLCHFAEELCCRPDFINYANANFRGVVFSSGFARKKSIDAGLAVPSASIGFGADHFEVTNTVSYKRVAARAFRFMIDARRSGKYELDTIVGSFCNVFDRDDDVSLVIVDADETGDWCESIHDISQQTDNNPDVVLVRETEQSADIGWIIDQCNVIIDLNTSVCNNDSLLRAVWAGLPAIVTGYGSHMEFCSENNSWLVDYELSLAGMDPFDTAAISVNFLKESLESALWHAYSCGPQERFRRGEVASRALRDKFTWGDVARRLSSFCDERIYESAKIGWVTTWNVACGIGTYVEHLLSAPRKARHFIFAADQQPVVREDAPNVSRVWSIGKTESDFRRIEAEVRRNGIDAVVVQFNYGFYNHFDLRDFVLRLKENGVAVIIDLHSTVDHGSPNYRLSDFREALAVSDRVLIHNRSDFANMRSLDLADNITYFPLGVLRRAPKIINGGHRDFPVITTFGFCFEGKGLVELIHAVKMLRESGFLASLRMLNAEYPADHSKIAVASVRRTIDELNASDYVDFRTDYLDDETCMCLIGEADLFVNAYKYTTESASASTRYGLATSVPVAVTPLSIFDDLGDAVFRMSGTDPTSMADSLKEIWTQIRANSEQARRVKDAADLWRYWHDYERLGDRLEQMITAVTRKNLASASCVAEVVSTG